MSLGPIVKDILGFWLGEGWKKVSLAEILSVAEDAGIFLILVKYLEDCGVDLSHYWDWISFHRLSYAARRGVWFQALRSIKSKLEGIDFLVLKGYFLGDRLFGYGMRDSIDIDLWVDEFNLVEVDERLRLMGYERQGKLGAVGHNQVEYVGYGVVVELHWLLSERSMGDFKFSDFYTRSLSVSCGEDCFVQILNEEDHFILLIIHAHRHFGALKPLLDLGAYFECVDVAVIHEGFIRGASYGLSEVGEYYLSLVKGMSDFKAELGLECKLGMGNVLSGLWLGYELHNMRGCLVCGRLRNDLVIGGASKFEALLGLCMRSGSMLMLDGGMRKWRGFWGFWRDYFVWRYGG